MAAWIARAIFRTKSGRSSRYATRGGQAGAGLTCRAGFGRMGHLFRQRWCAMDMPLITGNIQGRSEEHTSELQSLMRISYAVFCLKKKKKQQTCTSYQHMNTASHIYSLYHRVNTTTNTK